MKNGEMSWVFDDCGILVMMRSQSLMMNLHDYPHDTYGYDVVLLNGMWRDRDYDQYLAGIYAG